MVKTFIRANLQKNTGVLTATAANKSMDTGVHGGLAAVAHW